MPIRIAEKNKFPKKKVRNKSIKGPAEECSPAGLIYILICRTIYVLRHFDIKWRKT